MDFKRIAAVLLVVQLLFPAGVLAETLTTPDNLNLSSKERNVTLDAIADFQPTRIRVGASNKLVTANDLVTPAEFVALTQVLSGGGQTIRLNNGGAANGGFFSLMEQNLADIVVPKNVTAIHDFGNTGGLLNLTGDLTNKGTFFAVSSNSSITSANISATNIFNSGLLTSVLPANGLSGYSNLLSSLNLNLNASHDIVNTGTISSSGSLSLVAGNSIVNSVSATIATTVANQAIGNMNLQALNVFNQGFISAQNNLSISAAGLTNEKLVESVLGSIEITNSVRPELGINLVSSDEGLISAVNGTVNIHVVDPLSKTTVNVEGGTLQGAAVNFNAGEGHLVVNVRDIIGPVDVHTGTAKFAVTDGTQGLNLRSFEITGDPDLIYSGAGPFVSTGFVSLGGIVDIDTSSDTANGSITFTGLIDTRQDTLVSGNGGSVNLNAGTFISIADVNTSGNILGSGGNVTLVAREDITTGNILQSGVGGSADGSLNISAGTGGSGNLSLGGVTAGAITASAQGTMNLTGAVLSSGNVSLTGNGITVGSPLSATGSISALSNGALSVSSITGSSTVFLEATGGNLTMGGAINSTGLLTARTITSGNITQNGTVTAGGYTVQSAGNVTLNNTVSSTGNVSLTGNVIDADSLISSTGGISATSNGALSVAGLTSGTTVTLQATGADLTMSGPVTASGLVTAQTNTSGNIIQSGNVLAIGGYNVTSANNINITGTIKTAPNTLPASGVTQPTSGSVNMVAAGSITTSSIDTSGAASRCCDTTVGVGQGWPAPDGGSAGNVTLQASGNIQTGFIRAFGAGGTGGGSYVDGGDGGDGGAVNLTSTAGSISVGADINTSGGGGGNAANNFNFGGAGGNAGNISLSAASNVTVSGPVLAAGGGGGGGDGSTYGNAGGGSFGGGGGGGNSGGAGGGLYGGGGASNWLAGGGGGAYGGGLADVGGTAGTPGQGGNSNSGNGGVFGLSGFMPGSSPYAGQQSTVEQTGVGPNGGAGGTGGTVNITGSGVAINGTVDSQYSPLGGTGFSSSPYASVSLWGGNVTITSTGAGGISNSGQAYGQNLTYQTTAASTGNINVTASVSAANTLTVDMAGSGNLTQTAGVSLSGANVALSTAGGDIGTTVQNMITNAGSSLSVNSAGNAYITNPSAVNLSTSTVAGELIVQSSNAISTTGTISADTVELKTTANNAGINLGSDVNGATSVTISANGSGNIAHTAGTVSGATVNLTSTSGNIGSSLNPVSVSAGLLNASTSGQIFISQIGDLTLGTINVPNDFYLATAGNIITAGTIDASTITLITVLGSNGSITLNNTLTAAGGVTLISDGSGDITQLSGDIITTPSSSGSGGAVNVTAGGALSLRNVITSGNTDGTGGAVTLVSGSNMSFLDITSTAGSNTGSGGALSLNSGGTISGNGINASSSNVGAGGVGGVVTITAAGNVSLTGDVDSTGDDFGGGVSITSTGGGLTLQNIISTSLTGGANVGNAGAISLTAAGAIIALDLDTSCSPVGGTGGAITIDGGSVNVGLVNSSGSLQGGSAGDVAITSASTITLNDALNAAGDGSGGGVALDAQGNISINGSVETYAVNGVGGTVTMTTTSGDVIVAGDILTHAGDSSVSPGKLNGSGGFVTISGATGAVDIQGDIKTYGTNVSFGGLVTINLNGASLDVEGMIDTTSQQQSGGDVLINGTSSGVTLNSNGVSATAIKTTSGGNSTFYTGTVRVLVPTAPVTVTGTVDTSSSDQAVAGNVVFQTDTLQINGNIITTSAGASAGTVDLSAAGNLTVGNIDTRGATTSGVGFGGVVMIAAGTAGTGGSLTFGDVTSGASGALQSAGSVLVLASGDITGGVITATGSAGAIGGSVTYLAGTQTTSGDINYGSINTSGEYGGQVSLVSMGTSGLISSSGSTITTDATGVDGLAGSVGISSTGVLDIGAISTQANAGGSTSAWAGSVFITSGSTAANAITVGNITTDSVNNAGNVMVVHEAGVTPTVGTISQSGTNTPYTWGLAAGEIPTSSPATITDGMVISFSSTGVNNYNPGGFDSADAGANITIDTNGDQRLFAPIVVLNGDINFNSITSAVTVFNPGVQEAASPISLFSSGAITVANDITASSVGLPAPPVSFVSNIGVVNLPTINVSGEPAGSIIITTPTQFTLQNGDSLIANSTTGQGGRVIIAVPDGIINLGSAGNTSSNVIDVSGISGGIVQLNARGDINIYEVEIDATGTTGNGGEVRIESSEGSVNFYYGYSGGIPYTSTIDASSQTAQGGTIAIYGKYDVNVLLDPTLSAGAQTMTFNADGFTQGGVINIYSSNGDIDLTGLDYITAKADLATGTGGTVQFVAAGLVTTNEIDVRGANGGIVDSVSAGFNLYNAENIMANGTNGTGGAISIYTQGVRTFNANGDVNLGSANNQTNNYLSASGTTSGGSISIFAGRDLNDYSVDLLATGGSGDGGDIYVETPNANINLYQLYFESGGVDFNFNAEIDASSATTNGGTVYLTSTAGRGRFGGDILSLRDTSITTGATTTTAVIKADGITGGGDVDLISAGAIDLTEYDYTSASSTGPGSTGGNINVDAGNTVGPVTLTTLTTTSPVGGTITVEGTTVTLLSGENIESIGQTGAGGSITIDSTGFIQFSSPDNNTGNFVSASGATNGGIIDITSGDYIDVYETPITANGGTGNGGSISVIAETTLNLYHQYWDNGGVPANFNSDVTATGGGGNGGTIALSGNTGIYTIQDVSNGAKTSGNTTTAVIDAGGTVADGSISLTSLFGEIDLRQEYVVKSNTSGAGGPVSIIAGDNIYTVTGSTDNAILNDGILGSTITVTTTANDGSIYIEGDLTGTVSIDFTAAGAGNIVHNGALNTDVLTAPTVNLTSGTGLIGTSSGVTPSSQDPNFVFTDAGVLTANTASNVYINNLSANVSVGNSSAGTGNNIFMLQSAGNITTTGTVSAGGVQNSFFSCCGGFSQSYDFGIGSVHMETYANNGSININSNVTGYGALNLIAQGTGTVSVGAGATASSFNAVMIQAYDVAIDGTVSGKGQHLQQNFFGTITDYYWGTVQIIPNGAQSAELGRTGGIQTAAFDLDSAEFGRIVTDTLTIGDLNGSIYTNTGDITLVGDVDISGPGPGGYYGLSIYTGGSYIGTGNTITLSTGATDQKYLTVTTGTNINTGNVSGGYYISFDAANTVTVDGVVDNTNSLATSKYVYISADSGVNVLAGASASSQYTSVYTPQVVNDGTLSGTSYVYLRNYSNLPNTDPQPSYDLVVSGSGTLSAPTVYLYSYHYTYDPVTFASTFQGGNVSVAQGSIIGSVTLYSPKGATVGTGFGSVSTTNSDLTIGSVLGGSYLTFETSGSDTLTIPALSAETITLRTGNLFLGGNVTSTAGALLIESPAGSGLTINSAAARTLSSTAGTTIRAGDGALTFASSLNINNSAVTLDADGVNGEIVINTGIVVSSNNNISASTYTVDNSGRLTTTRASGTITVTSPGDLTIEGTNGIFSTTGTGTKSISFTATAGDLDLLGTQSYTSASTVNFNAAAGAINFGAMQTVNSGAAVNVASPSLSFANSSGITATGASAISITGGGVAATQAFTINDGATATLATTGGTISITPTAGQALTFSPSGAGLGTLQLNGATTATGAGISVNSGVALTSNNNVTMTASGNLTVDGSISASNLTLQTTAASDGNISFSANASATGTLIVAAGDQGNISQTAGLLSGQTVTLSSTSGFIGTNADVLQTAAVNLTANTAGNVYINELDGVTVGASTGDTFQFTSGGTINTNGLISGDVVSLATNALSGGSINIGAGITGNTSIDINADSTGDITQSAGVLSGPSVTLTSGSGNIGTALNNIQTDTDLLTANTSVLGTGSVYLNEADTTVVGGSTAGDLYQLTVGGNVATSLLDGTVQAQRIGLYTSLASNGEITVDSVMTAPVAVTLGAGGSGDIIYSSGSVDSDVVTLLSTSGNIGSSANPIITNANTLWASTTGNIYVRETDALDVADVSGNAVVITTGGNLTTVGTIGATDLTLTTRAGSAGTISLGSNVTGNTTIRLNADNTGDISRTAGTVSGGALIMVSGSGSIGASGAEIQTDVTSVSANTTGDVYVTEANDLTVNGTTGNTIVITSSGAMTTAGVVNGGTVTLQTVANDSGITLGNNVLATGVLTVSADGAGSISRTGGTLTANSLILSSTSGAIGAVAPGNIQTNANSISANTSGDVYIREANAVTVNQSTGNTFQLIAGGTITTAGTVTADALTLQASSGSGGSILLGADTTGTTSVTLSADGAGTIGQTGGTVFGGVLTIDADAGSTVLATQVDQLFGTTTGGSITINQTTKAMDIGGVAAAAGSLSVTSTHDVTVSGAVTANGGVSITNATAADTINITGAGLISSNGGTGLTLGSNGGNIDVATRVDSLDASSAGGNVTVAQSGINLDVTSVSGQGGTFILTSTNDVSISGSVTANGGVSIANATGANVIDITGNGLISSSGGTGLSLTSNGGNIDLSTQVDLLTASSNGGNITVSQSGMAVDVTSISAGAGTFALDSTHDVTLSGAVTANGGVTIANATIANVISVSGAGLVTSVGGTGLNVSSNGGQITLSTSVDKLNASSAGADVTIAQSGVAIDVQGVSAGAGSFDLTSTHDVSVSGAVTANGGVSITNATGADVIDITGTGLISSSGGSGLNLNSNGGNIDVATAVDQLTASSAGGSINVAQTGLALSLVSVDAGAGSFGLTSTHDVTVNGAVTANGGVTIANAGALNVIDVTGSGLISSNGGTGLNVSSNGGAIDLTTSIDRFAASSAGGNITISQSGLVMDLGNVSAGAGSFDLTSTDAVTISGTVTANGGIDIDVDGSITSSGAGSLGTTGLATLRSNGFLVDVNTAVAQIDADSTAGAVASDIILTQTGAINVVNINAGDQSFILIGNGDITVTGPIVADTAITLDGGATGDVFQQFGTLTSATVNLGGVNIGLIGEQIQTSTDFLSINGTGDAFVSEADDVTMNLSDVDGALTMAVPGTLTMGGNLTIGSLNLTTPNLVNNQTISATTTVAISNSGNLNISGNAGTLSGTFLTLTSTNGAVSAVQDTITGTVDGTANTSFDLTALSSNLSVRDITATTDSMTLEATSGVFTLVSGGDLLARNNVNIIAGAGVVIGANGGARTTINAGELALGFGGSMDLLPILSTTANGSILIDNYVNGNATGDVYIWDNVEMTSRGGLRDGGSDPPGSIGIQSSGSGSIFADGNDITLTAWGGDIWLSAGDDLTIGDDAELNSIGKLEDNGGMRNVSGGKQVPNYVGGRIGLYAGVPGMDYEQLLDQAVGSRGGPQRDFPGRPLFNDNQNRINTKNGSFFQVVLPGGTDKSTIVNNEFRLDGGVIVIDPPIAGTNAVSFNNSSLFAIGPPLQGGGGGGGGTSGGTTTPPTTLPPTTVPDVGGGGKTFVGNLNGTSITPLDTARISMNPTTSVLNQPTLVQPGVGQYFFATNCQPFVMKDHRDTIILGDNATFGTADKTEPEETKKIIISKNAIADSSALKLEQGKLLVIAGDQNVTVETAMGVVNVPMGSTSIVERTASGVVRVANVSGQDATLAVKQKDGQLKQLTAAQGEEVVIADETLEEEELIPVDGVDREPISAGAITVAGARVAKRKFDRDQMRDRERLFRCNFSEFYPQLSKKYNKVRDSLRSSIPVEKQGLKSSLPAPAKNIASQIEDTTSMVPVAFAQTIGVVSKLTTLSLKTAQVRHTGGANIAFEGASLLNLKGGEVIVAANEDTVVRADSHLVTVGGGSIAMITHDQSGLRVRNLYEKDSNSIKAYGPDKSYVDIGCGGEIIVAASARKVLESEPIGRRRVKITQMNSGHQVATGEVALSSLTAISDVLFKLLNSDADDDKQVATRIMKTAVILNIVTNGHGPFSSAVKP